MGISIRSQDKETLLSNVPLQLQIKNLNNAFCIVNINFQNVYGINFLNLGSYKTKERALEVLDEISYLMLPVKETLDENGESEGINYFANENYMYYEMPIDDAESEINNLESIGE